MNEKRIATNLISLYALLHLMTDYGYYYEQKLPKELLKRIDFDKNASENYKNNVISRYMKNYKRRLKIAHNFLEKVGEQQESIEGLVSEMEKSIEKKFKKSKLLHLVAFCSLCGGFGFHIRNELQTLLQKEGANRKELRIAIRRYNTIIETFSVKHSPDLLALNFNSEEIEEATTQITDCIVEVYQNYNNEQNGINTEL